MKTNVNKFALLGLHASVGVVVLVQAALLALAPDRTAAFHKTGMPDAIRLGLAWGEIVFACLFLIPRTMKLGGYGLLIIFTCAMGLHFLHGVGGFEVLLIYAAAVTVMVSARPEDPGKTMQGSAQ